MKWAQSTLRQRHSTFREWQCTFDDHGEAFDVVFALMVVSVVQVTKLAMEGKVTFQRNVAEFSSCRGGDVRGNWTRSPSVSCISDCSAGADEDHTYRAASAPLPGLSIPILTVIVLIISVRPRFALL